LRFKELKLLLRRISALNQTALYSGNKIFLQTGMRRHLFQDPSAYDNSVPKDFSKSGQEFADLSVTVIRDFCQIIDQFYPAPQSTLRSQTLQLIGNTLYIVFVDQVSVDKFLDLKWVFPIVNHIVADQGHIFDRFCARAESGFRPSVLEAAKALLRTAMNSCPFSTMIHFALRSVVLIESAVPKNSEEKEDMILSAVAWCVVHLLKRPSALQYLVQWGFFVEWFFPKRVYFQDLISGLDERNWTYFEELFKEIRAATPAPVVRATTAAPIVLSSSYPKGRTNS
jgi:hypothetical protein